MDYSSSQKKFYIRNSNQSSTFQHDSNLPKLPIPDLEQTITKYLKSIKPFVSDQEFKNTMDICQEFIDSGEGEKLQQLLILKAEVKSFIYRSRQ